MSKTGINRFIIQMHKVTGFGVIETDFLPCFTETTTIRHKPPMIESIRQMLYCFIC